MSCHQGLSTHDVVFLPGPDGLKRGFQGFSNNTRPAQQRRNALAARQVLDLQSSAYVSIRQHTSAYVSIRQHTQRVQFWICIMISE